MKRRTELGTALKEKAKAIARIDGKVMERVKAVVTDAADDPSNCSAEMFERSSSVHVRR